MYHLGVAALLLLPAPGLVTAAGSCVEGTNKHGVCGCDGQIFLNSDCSEGFYCTGTDSGCLLSCEPDQVILIDPRNNTPVLDYKCVSRAENQKLCPGKMNTDCPCEEAGCEEFGECECALQLWVSSDCKKARLCNDRAPEQLRHLNCTTDGEIVDVNLVSRVWQCIPDDGRCLNKSFRIGCQRDDPTSTATATPSPTPTPTATATPTATPTPTPTAPPVTLCSYANNTLGTCECGKQLFINEDCTEGFFCMDGTFPPGVVADGCRKKCEKDEILIVNVAKNTWDCVPKSFRPGVLPLICPGKFKIECPGNGDIGECECDGQLWINEDCRKGFFCGSQFAGGGKDIECKEDERIEVNMVNTTWYCIKDDGQCPGGFHVGCQSDSTTVASPTSSLTSPIPTSSPASPTSSLTSPIPTSSPAPTSPAITLCSYANNTLGTCECGKQLFINEDCTEGFFCMDGTFPAGVVADGCRKKCEKDEILIVNVAQNTWNCVPKSYRPGVLPLLCPGKFNIECPGNGDIGKCECDGQLWISEDCRKGFFCGSQFAGGGKDIECKEDERIEVNMVNATWYCIKDDGQCPGAFHVGCQSDPSSAIHRSAFDWLIAVSMAILLSSWLKN